MKRTGDKYRRPYTGPTKIEKPEHSEAELASFKEVSEEAKLRPRRAARKLRKLGVRIADMTTAEAANARRLRGIA